MMVLKIKRGSFGPKVISGMLTLVIVSVLLIAGPVQAFVLGLTADDTHVTVGETIHFQAEAVFSNEPSDVSMFIIDLGGPVSLSCSFLPDGTPVSSCVGFTITPVEDSLYGYGYGYGTSGKLVFNISLATGSVPAGVYDTELLAVTPSGIERNDGPVIEVLAQAVLLERCSVRADDGSMILYDDSFGSNNDLNFNIPNAKAVMGQGSFTAQHNGKRFTYSFDVTDILSSMNGNSTIAVDGHYRLQRGTEYDSSAIIYLNKNKGVVNIVAPDFNVTYLNVDFIKGC